MAETLFSFLLDQLSTFLSQEQNLLGGLKQEVQHISDELGHIRAFLRVAEAKEEDDPRLQEWMKQVREAAYDIEDVLDEFMYLFASHHANGCTCVRKIFKLIKNFRAHHRIANDIQSIKLRIKNISEAHQRYQLHYGAPHNFPASAPISNTWWDDSLLMGNAKLVGIQEPKRQLTSQFLDGDANLKVISVFGMQGLGKTTLAKKVHEDSEVRKQFPISAWVAASETRGIRDLLRDLIRQICEQIKKPIAKIVESITTIDDLKSHVRYLLQGKRYALFFDDVCNKDIWNSIKSALPENTNGSRVMLTTRVPDVAQASCPVSQGYVYKMQPLPFDESWNLFCNRAFKNKKCPIHLVNVAQDILRKCVGLPLAIVAVSGVLASKDPHKIEEWDMVRLGLEREEEGTGRLEKTLHLSYKDLPSHLKTCLLYMSIFPKDYDIQCHRLIQLWIAERFVHGWGVMTTEEVAWEYLKELIARSLVRVTEVSWDGSPDHCRIHELMRDIVLCKSQEKNMITIASEQQTRDPEKVYRLVINDFLPNIQKRNYLNHLRSLITFGSLESRSKTLFSELLSSKLLKILDFTDAQLEEIPNEVFNLFHLRYLCLRGTRVKTVPKSIKKLQNLEHLHLGQTNVRELPMEISKLQKLRHLRVFQVVDPSHVKYECFGFKAESTVGELLSLQSLRFIDAQNDKASIVKEIGKLIQLRELGITNLRRGDGKEFCSSLQKLTRLCELDITAIEKDEVIDMDYPLSSSSLQLLRGLTLRGSLEKFPQWIRSLRSLMKIELSWSRSRDDNLLESLQHLPNLVEVYLSQAYEGESLCFKDGCFLKLEKLSLRVFNT